MTTDVKKKEEYKKALSHLGAIVIGILIGILGLKNCEGDQNVDLGPETLVQLPPVPTKTIAKLERQTVVAPAMIATRTSTRGVKLDVAMTIDFAPDLCPKPEPFASLDCGDKSLNEKERAAKAAIACKVCAEDKGYGPILAQSKAVVAKADECRKAQVKVRTSAPAPKKVAKAQSAAKKMAEPEAGVTYSARCSGADKLRCCEQASLQDAAVELRLSDSGKIVSVDDFNARLKAAGKSYTGPVDARVTAIKMQCMNK